MSEPKVKCSQRIYDGTFMGYMACPYNGKIERDGKWYCGRHDPVKVKERRDKSTRAFEEKMEAREAARNAPGLRIKELEEALVQMAGYGHDRHRQEMSNAASWKYCTFVSCEIAAKALGTTKRGEENE